QERIAFMLADAQISVLLTQERLRVRFSASGATIVCLDSHWLAIAEQPRQNLRNPSTAEQLAYIIYTSGSTGQPKDVQICQRSVGRLVCGVEYVQLDQNCTLLHMAPISFDAATFEVWGALLHGGRCVLFAEDLPGVQAISEVLHREAV